MDAADRSVNRAALERHIKNEAPGREAAADQGPSRPNALAYRLRLADSPLIHIQQERAHYYNQVVNREWFDYQRRNAEPSRAEAAAAPPSPPDRNPSERRADLRADFRAAAREVTGRDNDPPQRSSEFTLAPDGPERPPPGASAVSRQAAARARLEAHLEQSNIRADMRQTGRETLERHLEAPARPSPSHEFNRTRGLER